MFLSLNKVLAHCGGYTYRVAVFCKISRLDSPHVCFWVGSVQVALLQVSFWGGRMIFSKVLFTSVYVYLTSAPKR